MKLTAKIKLNPTQEQADMLHETLNRVNAACNVLSSVVWEEQRFKKYDLHERCYYAIREQFELPSQCAVRAISKTIDAYKTEKTLLAKRNQKIASKNKTRLAQNKGEIPLKTLSKINFAKYGAFPLDARLVTYVLDEQKVSIRLLNGRETMSFQAGDRQLALLQYQKGESDLVYSRGHFYLCATCDVPVPEEMEVDDFLGVDLGIVNIATTSDGVIYKGNHVNKVRHRNKSLRKKLQKKGTKSAKRLLKKRSKKERRFANDVNHCISKQLVLEAKRTSRGIALEDLKGIRERVRLRKSQRSQLHSWSFDDLKRKITYKAALYGVPLRLVDPRNTSRMCPECGHIDKQNRKTQACFECQACGFSAHADLVGATNIGRRAVSINTPYAASAL